MIRRYCDLSGRAGRTCQYALGAFTICVTLAVGASFADEVDYEATFTATWSEDTTPGAFPGPSAHFSPLIGGTHNSSVSFWDVGGQATQGIENMAETGGTNSLSNEVQTAIRAGTAAEVIRGGGIGISPGSATARFTASSAHPLATLVSMIAPSPDWFVGVSGLNLRSEGLWLDNVVVDLEPYDAGTDSGPSFTSRNDDTNPAESIRVLAAPFQEGASLGTFTFRLRSLPGDLNSNGAYDAEDVNLLCDQLETSSTRFDFTDDGLVTMEDVEFLVETLIGTVPGDTNLDLDVDFDDFQALADGFGLPGHWGNGDFDCSGTVQFPDFAGLANNFGFGDGQVAAAAVPEPNSTLAAVCGLTVLMLRRRSS